MEDDKPVIVNGSDEEMIDFNLGEEDTYDEVAEESPFEKSMFTVDSLFIVVYEEDDNMIDKLLLVQQSIDGDNRIQLKDENDNDEVLLFDTNDRLLLKNDSYSNYS